MFRIPTDEKKQKNQIIKFHGLIWFLQKILVTRLVKKTEYLYYEYFSTTRASKNNKNYKTFRITIFLSLQVSLIL